MSVDSLGAVQSEKTEKKGGLGGLLGGGKTYFLAAGLASVVAMGGVFAILGEATQRTTYYVLGQDVPARTPISVEMLVPREAGFGTQPPNALDIAAIRDNAFVSLTPLRAGDVLSPSVVGPLTRISTNLPKNFVVTSFSVAPENAVAGKVRKGDYIDLIATAPGDGLGKVVMRHVLVLDVTVSPASIAQGANSGQAGADVNPGPESAAIRSGIPALYTVGVSSEDAVRLALVKNQNLSIVLSPTEIASSADVKVAAGDIYSKPVGDSGAGTEKAAETAKTENGQSAPAPGTGQQQEPAAPAPAN